MEQINNSNLMEIELSKLFLYELYNICKKLKFIGYSGKKKAHVIDDIIKYHITNNVFFSLDNYNEEDNIIYTNEQLNMMNKNQLIILHKKLKIENNCRLAICKKNVLIQIIEQHYSGTICKDISFVKEWYMCINIDCSQKANYGNKNEKKKLYCYKHKENNMVYIGKKICEHEYEDGNTCTKMANYNYKNEKIGKYCKPHSLENMVDLKHKICEFNECKYLALYNNTNEKKGKFCKKHIEKNMVEIQNRKKCEFVGCKKIPSYNFRNFSGGKYCKSHCEIDMEDVVSLLCNVIDCKTQAAYNYKGRVMKFCKKHSSPDMIDLRQKRCKLCETSANKKYNGYCSRCFIYTFPDNKIVKNFKVKERHVTDYIKEQYQNINIITDKTVKNGCSKKRPDILIELDKQYIIIEIDENQHKNYDCSCENKRIMELYNDLNQLDFQKLQDLENTDVTEIIDNIKYPEKSKNVIFIRFNPDSYFDINNVKIKSPFVAAKNTGVLCVNNKKEFNNRLKVLKDTIQYWVDNETEKTIEIEQLFYDQNIIKDEKDEEDEEDNEYKNNGEERYSDMLVV